MAVNLSPPSNLLSIDGIRLGCTCAIQINKHKRDDLTAIAIAANASVAGVFTQNRFPAPPIVVCREHIKNNIRGLVINAGIANAGTLGRGLRDARHSCKLFADILNQDAKITGTTSAKFIKSKNAIKPINILPFSTGVIMEYLPMQQYAAGLLRCGKDLSADNWHKAAKAIMTTDTIAKGVSVKIKTAQGIFRITGIAKGSGMIHPNMATMLSFIATDAPISRTRLASWQKEIAADTFNAISVDGDTSTNDSFILIATGKAKLKNASNSNSQSKTLTAATAAKIKSGLMAVASQLAEAIIRDGEGATKLVTIHARGAPSKKDCVAAAEALARSPLVKTALAASDANVGRLLMALGNADAKFAPDKVSLHIGTVPVIKNGGIHPQYNEKRAAALMAKNEIVISLNLGKSAHCATIKTCDLTHGYISINADYRS